MKNPLLLTGEAIAKQRGSALRAEEIIQLNALHKFWDTGNIDSLQESEQSQIFSKSREGDTVVILPPIMTPFIMPEISSVFGKSFLTVDSQSGLNVIQTTLLENGMQQTHSEPASLFALATKIPTLGEAKWPQLTQETPTVGDGSESDFAEVGEALVAWKADGAESQQSEAKFEQKRIMPFEVSGYSEFSYALWKRAGANFPSMLKMFYRAALLHALDQAIILGTGVGQMKGYLTEAILSANRATPNAISYDDLADLESALAPQFRSNAVWVTSKTAFTHLKKKKDSQNRPLFPKLGGPNPTLNEYPVIISQRCPALGTEGDISLGDFSQYVCAVEEDLFINLSAFAKLKQQVVCTLIGMNVGGKVVHPRAFVKLV